MPRGSPRKNDAASPRTSACDRAAAARASLPFNLDADNIHRFHQALLWLQSSERALHQRERVKK